MFSCIGCVSTTRASHQETNSCTNVWRPRCGSARGVVWDEHLLHDGQLAQAAAAHLHKLHEAAAGDLTLSQADVHPDAAQHVFTDGPAKVQVSDGCLLAEEGLKLLRST